MFDLHNKGRQCSKLLLDSACLVKCGVAMVDIAVMEDPLLKVLNDPLLRIHF